MLFITMISVIFPLYSFKEHFFPARYRRNRGKNILHKHKHTYLKICIEHTHGQRAETAHARARAHIL